MQAIERFVWDGAQRLLELRDWGDTAQTLAGNLNANGGSSGYFFGQVRYTNAGTVDAPFLIAKSGTNTVTFVPQANWSGVYEDGTLISGSLGYTWPGLQQNFYMESDARFAPIYANMWLGDLIDGNGGMDPTGTVYFRNRYYDPRAGQFTQQDPIGLAGGVNVYGFAGGDPVNSSDPFGLRPLTADERQRMGNYCDQVDCDKVNVHEGNDSEAENGQRLSWLSTSGGASITIGNEVYIADDAKGDFGTLAHELGHVYQFQVEYKSNMLRYGAAGVANQASNEMFKLTKGAIGRDEYATPMPPTKPFSQYRMNQQAEIVRLCVTRVSPSACSISPIRP